MPHSHHATAALSALALLAPPFALANDESSEASSTPRVVSTDVIGPFTGADAALHPDNLTPDRIAYYGTDLGFSYRHGDAIKFLFGDSWATESYAPIEASSGSRFDDMFGEIALSDWPDSKAIASDHIPTIRIGENGDSVEVAAIDVGHAMDLGKTPMGGFSTGPAEYGVFNLTKPQTCTSDDACGELSCDTGLGYLGVPATADEQLTLPCLDGSPFCVAETEAGVEESGFCVDPLSSVYSDTPGGRMASTALRVRIGRRDPDTPKRYIDTQDWLTNKFENVAVRAVQAFDPSGDVPADFSAPSGDGDHARVFLWGRPGFVGVNALDRTMSLYFATVDAPNEPDAPWAPMYFAGLDEDGAPRFSASQNDAAPLDLDAGTPGVQGTEHNDIVHQMSVAFIPELEKWLMFYGGGIIKEPTELMPACGVLQLFARDDCAHVDTGEGAIHMRTADAPWGPWSAPQTVIASGDPDTPGSGQFGPGGVLHHPACEEAACAAHSETPYYSDNEHGFFYSANIIEEWTQSDDAGVDIYWNASTWDPYRVVLLKTRIAR